MVLEAAEKTVMAAVKLGKARERHRIVVQVFDKVEHEMWLALEELKAVVGANLWLTEQQTRSRTSMPLRSVVEAAEGGCARGGEGGVGRAGEGGEDWRGGGANEFKFELKRQKDLLVWEVFVGVRFKVAECLVR